MNIRCLNASLRVWPTKKQTTRKGSICLACCDWSMWVVGEKWIWWILSFTARLIGDVTVQKSGYSKQTKFIFNSQNKILSHHQSDIWLLIVFVKYWDGNAVQSFLSAHLPPLTGGAGPALYLGPLCNRQHCLLTICIYFHIKSYQIIVHFKRNQWWPYNGLMKIDV